MEPIIENKVENHMSKKQGLFFLPHYHYHMMGHFLICVDNEPLDDKDNEEYLMMMKMK